MVIKREKDFWKESVEMVDAYRAFIEEIVRKVEAEEKIEEKVPSVWTKLDNDTSTMFVTCGQIIRDDRTGNMVFCPNPPGVVSYIPLSNLNSISISDPRVD